MFYYKDKVILSTIKNSIEEKKMLWSKNAVLS